MNLYEMTFIVRPDLDDEQTRAVADQITERLKTAGGEIAAAYPWMPARRRLAYPIKDFNDGYYVTTVFRLEPGELREFENGLKLNDNILRFLIVTATDNNIRQAQNRLHQLTQQAAMQAQQAQQAAARASQPAPSAAPEAADEQPATAAATETETVAAQPEPPAETRAPEPEPETEAEPAVATAAPAETAEE
ncbi:MAG TPA: 30S ribosomal protein S6 [Chloroflexota bacterium]|nr:30S ribosomal protein S6 [Chloroflexota bacterium]